MATFDLNNCCSRCTLAIASERLQLTPKVCNHCGYIVDNRDKEIGKQGERNSLIAVIGLAVAIALGFVHVVNWGAHSFEVLPLQAATFVGSESTAGIKRLSEICMDVKKFDCVERMYVRQALRDGTSWARLGNFQFSRGESAEATESFRQYFSKGGQDLDAAYNYARALSDSGRIDDAAKYFEYVLHAKPNRLQVTVAQKYVKMLVDAGRLDQALTVIDKIRRKGESASQFMDSEYKVIQGRLETHRHT